MAVRVRRSRHEPENEEPTEARSPERPAAQPSSLNPDQAAYLQRTIGNAAVARLVAENPQARNPRLHAPVAVEKEGEEVFEPLVAHAHPPAVLYQPEKNEFDEIDGSLGSNAHSCLFVDGGKVGEGKIYWAAGGTGGQGQQTVGSVDLVAPEYEGADGTSSAKAKAWIKPGTGTATVTRTYKGAVVGDNGPFYFTALASARCDIHEQLHVKSSKALHDKWLGPLEKRVEKHTGEPKAFQSGTTKDEAIVALKKFLDWNTAVTGFQTEDAAANIGGGTTDTLDMADPTFVANYGPRTVDGKHFDSYIDVPPGPGPATPNPTGAAGAVVGS